MSLRRLAVSVSADSDYEQVGITIDAVKSTSTASCIFLTAVDERSSVLITLKYS